MSRLNKIILIVFFAIIVGLGAFFIYKDNVSKRAEVVFWTLQMSDFSTYINKIILGFEKQNPAIKIKWVDIPFSEGEKRTLASILSDNPPDLINLNPDFSSILAYKGALWPINDEDLLEFTPEIIEALKINDKNYLIPWYATSAITIYNKKLLKTPPPETYDELAQIAPAVKKDTAKFITLPNITENDTMLKILNKYGINNPAQINSLKSVQIFDLFKSLYIKNYIPKETITITLQESLEKYMSQEIVLINAGANFLNMIKENAPQVYAITDVAPQIRGDIGQYDFSIMNFVIPYKAKHRKEALLFAKYLTSKEAQLELAKLTNVLVPNEEALKDDFYTKYDKGDLKAKARVISARQLDSIHPVFIAKKNQKEINNVINVAVQKILLNKSSTKDILDEVFTQWNTIAK